MNYVVFDLEWNQPMKPGDEEACALPFEIIEVGAVLLNEDRQIIGEFSEIVKPNVYHRINIYTKEIVNLQMKELRKGKPFPEVMDRFMKFCGEDCIFCTWGPGDLVELQRNMKYYDLPPLSDGPFRYYDVQKMFSLEFEGHKGARALDYAVEFLNIQKSEAFHRAYGDAHYTAKIFEKITSPEILEKFSYDTYHIPQKRNEEVYASFPGYSKYISHGFRDKTEAIHDREVISSRCPVCNNRLKKCVRTFTPGGKYYLNVAVCEEHGYLKSKIRIKKTDEGTTYVVKTQRFVTEDEVAQIAGKRAHIHEVKRMKEELAKRKAGKSRQKKEENE